MTTQKIISLVPVLFITWAVIAGWIRFNKFSSAVKSFVIAWTLVFLVETTGHVLGYFKIRNLWLYNIFFFLWFSMLVIAFRQVITNDLIKKIIKFFLFLLPLFFIFNILFLQGNRNLQSLFFVVGGGFIIFLTLAYFMQLYNSDENQSIQRYPFFWFSIGLLVYFGISLAYIGMYNTIIAEVPGFARFYRLYISNTVIIFLNLCVVRGFLCKTNYQN